MQPPMTAVAALFVNRMIKAPNPPDPQISKLLVENEIKCQASNDFKSSVALLLLPTYIEVMERLL